MENNMRHECHSCHITTIEKLVEKFNPDSETAESLMASVNKLLTDNS